MKRNNFFNGRLACPGGTYRSDRGPGDIRSCTPCPDENHISEAGSTSADQCVCPRGYLSEDGNSKCRLLACPKLEPPANGYFIKNVCNSVFNGACGIRCNAGYKLVLTTYTNIISLNIQN